jgi:hypothetical protein
MSAHDMPDRRFKYVALDVAEAMNFFHTFGFIVIEDFLTQDTVSLTKNIIAL